MKPLNEDELEETFSHASGPGGQNVNKVATKVTLRHVPTKLSVSVQESRSQARNRELARERLAALIEEEGQRKARERRNLRERNRRRNRPRPPKVKRKMRESKRQRSDLKKRRGKIRPADV